MALDDLDAARRESHVRLSAFFKDVTRGRVEGLAGGDGRRTGTPPDVAEEVLEELRQDHLSLSTALSGLSAVGLVGAVAAMRDAMATLHRAAIPKSLHHAFLPEGPLAEYTQGLYAWMFTILEALGDPRPDLRLREARDLHFEELQGPIRRHLATLRGGRLDVEALRMAVENVFSAASVVEQRIDEPVG